MLADVAAGLSAPQKELSPKYLCDQRGSELFEQITRLPEYYQTRTERALLEGWMPSLVRRLGTRTLVELGAGSAEKSRVSAPRRGQRLHHEAGGDRERPGGAAPDPPARGLRQRPRIASTMLRQLTGGGKTARRRSRG